jgi:molybdopterin converting factor small subunit
MNQVTIELCLWLEQELEGDLEPLSEMRSMIRERVENGITGLQLLNRLGRRISLFAREVFDPENNRLNPNVVLIYNDRVISYYEFYEEVINDGDKITVLPRYAGG